ncbi:Motile sperm domain-containing protein 2-like protein [Dinothrombium tinctorium]|uniref:Motile sperm domain-containing protein 2-like protein n=1 Tax=Dinothrombium tinctorium TaxID=1965070 RepID=A0A443QSQ0_9ACAR|nr:Motile sperm domain-containing protein 2-like protein [Dinothrombium tinctorium]
MPACDYTHGPIILETLRQRFREYYEEDDPSLYYHQDVQNVLYDDWWIMRYLNDHDGDENESFKALIKCMKWRKLQGIREIEDNYFPEELFRLGAVFQYCHDKSGFPTFYIRLKLVRKCAELQLLMKKYIAHCINKIDEETWGKGWALIIDFGGIRLQHVDFEMAKYLLTTLKTYFPSGVAYGVCVDFPWVLRAFLNLIKSLIPANQRYLIKFSTRNDLREYIDEVCLPDFMHGYCKRPYKGSAVVPYGSPNFNDFCHFELGLPLEVCHKITEIYRPFLPDD